MNYRSTQEVLDVSNVFVAALCSQFEGHVDKLPREVAPFRGNFKVRLLRGSDWEAIGDAVFGDGTREEVSEFGAQQCVIVPDEAAKRNLPPSFAGALCFTPWKPRVWSSTRPSFLDAFRDTDAGWWQALAEDGRFPRPGRRRGRGRREAGSAALRRPRARGGAEEHVRRA